MYLPSCTDTSADTPAKVPRTTELHQEQELGKASRRLFLDTDDNSDDHLPLEYRYLRDSERKVKDKV